MPSTSQDDGERGDGHNRGGSRRCLLRDDENVVSEQSTYLHTRVTRFNGLYSIPSRSHGIQGSRT